MLKSRLTFVFALACAMLLARFYADSDIAFLGVYAMLLLGILCLVSVITAPMSLRLEERISDTEIFKNETLEYVALLRNRGIFFFPRITLDYHNVDVLEYGESHVAMMPRGRSQLGGGIHFPFRGVYRLGVQSVSVTDFLGLFRVTFPVRNPLQVTVYPESDETFSLYVRPESPNTVFRYDRFNESYADVADVRKYTSSDSFRMIHWKLSAKRGELMVKNFQSFEPNKTLLYIDTREIPLEPRPAALFADKMVSYAASAVNHCASSRTQSFLASGDRLEDQVAIDPAESLGKVYTVLAEMAFDREASAFPAFCDSLERHGDAYNLLLFIAHMDEEVHDAITRFATFDDNLFIYFFYSKELPLTESMDIYLESLKSQGVSVSRIPI